MLRPRACFALTAGSDPLLRFQPIHFPFQLLFDGPIAVGGNGNVAAFRLVDQNIPNELIGEQLHRLPVFIPCGGLGGRQDKEQTR